MDTLFPRGTTGATSCAVTLIESGEASAWLDVEEVRGSASVRALARAMVQRLADRISQVDDRDKDTPDSWLPRHPELVRLTVRSITSPTHGAGRSWRGVP